MKGNSLLELSVSMPEFKARDIHSGSHGSGTQFALRCLCLVSLS